MFDARGCTRDRLQSLADDQAIGDQRVRPQLDRAALFYRREPKRSILRPCSSSAVRMMPIGTSVLTSRISATKHGERCPSPNGQG